MRSFTEGTARRSVPPEDGDSRVPRGWGCGERAAPRGPPASGPGGKGGGSGQRGRGKKGRRAALPCPALPRGRRAAEGCSSSPGRGAERASEERCPRPRMPPAAPLLPLLLPLLAAARPAAAPHRYRRHPAGTQRAPRLRPPVPRRAAPSWAAGLRAGERGAAGPGLRLCACPFQLCWHTNSK